MTTKYKILAATYEGHKQGEEVELDLTFYQERRALESGAIKKATTPKKHKEETNDE